jgi:hypothetical protein
VCAVAVSFRLDAWTDLVATLQIDAAEFVHRHVDDIMSGLKNSATLSTVRIFLGFLEVVLQLS